MFDAATPVARIREGSRSCAGVNAADPRAKRSHPLRSYVFCDLCGQRMLGKTRHHRRRDTTYYACVTNPAHHRHEPWYAEHPPAMTVREDHLPSGARRCNGGSPS